MKTKYIYFLILIIFIASFFRFFQITKFPPGLYPDEAMNGSNALEAIQKNDYKVFYPENNGREGLFINIQALFLKFFLSQKTFPEPWMLHIPSALFGILTVLGIFFLARELFRDDEEEKSKIIGLLAAFFLAISFWHINFSRIGFRAIMAPFFLTWGTWIFLIALRKNKNYFIATVGGVIYGLGMHSYIAYRATPLFILIMWIIFLKKYEFKKIIKPFIIFTIASIIVSLPLINYFKNNPEDFLGRTSQVSIFSGNSPIITLVSNSLKTFLGMFFFQGDQNWRHNLSGNPQLFFPVALLFGIGIFMIIKNFFYKKELRTGLIILSWLFIAGLPVIISSEGIPHALRAILMIPAVFIIVGNGGFYVYSWLQRKKYNKKMLYSCIICFFIILISQSYYSYFIVWGNKEETKGAFAKNYVDIANTINTLPREIPKYIVVNAGGTDVRGYPMPTQTIMFLTKSFLPEEQKERNISYIFPNEKQKIPQGSIVFNIQ